MFAILGTSHETDPGVPISEAIAAIKAAAAATPTEDGKIRQDDVEKLKPVVPILTAEKIGEGQWANIEVAEKISAPGVTHYTIHLLWVTNPVSQESNTHVHVSIGHSGKVLALSTEGDAG